MSALLHRPILWWRAGSLIHVSGLDGLTRYERALLYRLRHVSYSLSTNGDVMHDDVSSALRCIVPPAQHPVSLIQAKQFLRIEHDGDNAAIEGAIGAASVYAERYLRLYLLPQQWEYVLTCPVGQRTWFPVKPARSIVSVYRIDTQGQEALISDTSYRVSIGGDALEWLASPSGYAIKIIFSVGAYDQAADIPAPIIQGILHHVASMLEHRGGEVGLPAASVNGYAAFRQVTL